MDNVYNIYFNTKLNYVNLKKYIIQKIYLIKIIRLQHYFSNIYLKILDENFFDEEINLKKEININIIVINIIIFIKNMIIKKL